MKEALAIYDFHARTSRELSFSKGDVLFLLDKVSADWWEGATATSQKGLIPDKYIVVRHRSMSIIVNVNQLFLVWLKQQNYYKDHRGVVASQYNIRK